MVPLKLVGSLSKVHLYDNAIEQARLQLNRDEHKYGEVRLDISKAALGELNYARNGMMNPNRVIERLEIGDFNLINYEHYPKIKAKMLAYNK